MMHDPFELILKASSFSDLIVLLIFPKFLGAYRGNMVIGGSYIYSPY